MVKCREGHSCCFVDFQGETSPVIYWLLLSAIDQIPPLCFSNHVARIITVVGPDGSLKSKKFIQSLLIHLMVGATSLNLLRARCCVSRVHVVPQQFSEGETELTEVK